jgi:hypothetical protein
MMESEVTQLELSQIRIDGGTQVRETINQETVEDYKEAFLSGALFPPVDVFFDGETYWLADGFHRYHARSAANNLTISAAVHTGTLRDAILFAVGANAHHGLRRSRADKQRAIFRLLQDQEWSKWSDNVIAMKANASQPCVSYWRRNLSTLSDQNPNVRVRRDGMEYDPTNIGSVKRAKDKKRGGMPARSILDALERVDQSLDPWSQYRPVQSLIRQAMSQMIDIMQEHQRNRAA